MKWFYTQELGSSFLVKKHKEITHYCHGWKEWAPKLKTKVYNYEMVFHKQLPSNTGKEWDSHSQREMIWTLKPNYNWLNYPSPNLVPEVKWRGQEDVLRSGLALECCWVWWSDGEFPSFWGECHILAEGEGREQRAFDGSPRRETTLYLTQISAGQMGAQLSSEKQLHEEPRADSKASPKRSFGGRLSPAGKRQWRQMWGRVGETERDQRSHFLQSACGCLLCPHWAISSCKRQYNEIYSLSVY